MPDIEYMDMERFSVVRRFLANQILENDVRARLMHVAIIKLSEEDRRIEERRMVGGEGAAR
jgi:hypothetical protein